MKKIEIKTKRGLFSYSSYGMDNNPPVVMIHGWPETSYCWHHVALHMEDRFRIIAVDLRGTGGSNRSLDKSHYTKDQLGLDVLSMLDHIGIKEFFLVGHDWGAAVAQEIAIANADKVKKLCLLNMVIINNPKGKESAYKVLGKKLFYTFWYQWFQNLKELPEALIKDREDIWVRFFMRGMSDEIPEESINEYVKSYKVEGSITCAANLYRTMGQDMARWQSYEGQKFKMPSKLIYGNLDPIIIKEYFYDIESCFEEISITELEAGHFVADEKPQEVADIISEFIT